jgi:methionyl-tRNA formyltransferase
MTTNRQTMAIIGCMDFGHYCTLQLLKNHYHLDAIISLRPEQAARYNLANYQDYAEIARQYAIPIYYPREYSMKNDEDLAFFQAKRFDLLIIGGWNRLLPEEIVNTASCGALGIHGSSDFLPKGRGRSPLTWSLLEGKKRMITHLFRIRPGVDDGDLIDSAQCDITEFDDIRTLYMKTAIVSARMMRQHIAAVLSGEVISQKQWGEPSYYPKRTPADGLIDWENMDVWSIYNAVRAQTRPYPGAFALIAGQKYWIWKCRVFDTRMTYETAKYGDIVERFGDNLIINCRGGLLLLDEYSLAPADSDQNSDTNIAPKG